MILIGGYGAKRWCATPSHSEHRPATTWQTAKGSEFVYFYQHAYPHLRTGDYVANLARIVAA